MEHWKRRLFFALTIVFFLLISPIAILYTSGYRYDFDNKSLQKIGMIIIKTTPENADIYLNDQYVANKSPYKESSLFPDTYNVKISRDGYNSWEKSLTVKSKLVTWISYARIFLLDPPTRTVAERLEPADFALSPNYNKLAYVASDLSGPELWVTDIETLDQNKIFSAESLSGNYKKGSLTNLRWSPNNRNVLFDLTSGNIIRHFIVDIEKPTESTLMPQTNLKQLRWDAQDADFVYYLNKDSLYSLNLTKIIEPTTIAQNVVSYNFNSRSIYYLKRTTENNGLDVLNITKNQTEQNSEPTTISQVPDHNYTLEISPDNQLALLADNKTLYLADGNNFTKLKDNVLDFAWSAKDNGLVMVTENEVWFHKIEKDGKQIGHPQYSLNETNLLTRYSTKIDSAVWYPDEEHILFATNNKLYIKELDNRDKANSTELASDLPDGQQNIWFDKKGKKIYHQSTTGDTNAIIEKEIY